MIDIFHSTTYLHSSIFYPCLFHHDSFLSELSKRMTRMVEMIGSSVSSQTHSQVRDTRFHVLDFADILQYFATLFSRMYEEYLWRH